MNYFMRKMCLHNSRKVESISRITHFCPPYLAKAALTVQQSEAFLLADSNTGPRYDVVTQIDGSLASHHFARDQVRLFRSEVHTTHRRRARCHQTPLLE
jgi:hypothetical protein